MINDLGSLGGLAGIYQRRIKMYFKGLFNSMCYRDRKEKCIGMECSRYPVCYVEREAAIKQIEAQEKK